MQFLVCVRVRLFAGCLRAGLIKTRLHANYLNTQTHFGFRNFQDVLYGIYVSDRFEARGDDAN